MVLGSTESTVFQSQLGMNSCRLLLGCCQSSQSNRWYRHSASSWEHGRWPEVWKNELVHFECIEGGWELDMSAACPPDNVSCSKLLWGDACTRELRSRAYDLRLAHELIRLAMEWSVPVSMLQTGRSSFACTGTCMNPVAVSCTQANLHGEVV